MVVAYYNATWMYSQLYCEWDLDIRYEEEKLSARFKRVSDTVCRHEKWRTGKDGSSRHACAIPARLSTLRSVSRTGDLEGAWTVPIRKNGA